jgi:phospholipid-binding lipoprotein MlaA
MLGLAMAGTLAAGAALAQAPVQTAGQPSTPVGASLIPDPWERANHGFYRFSMGIDKAVIAPPVHAYMAVVPSPVRTGVKNVVNNLHEPRVAANDVLQLHPTRAAAAAVRFVVNSTLGLGGLFDFAGATGLPGHDSDFGQTLGRWGVGTGPYIFIPFYGPSDVRDGIGKIGDTVGDPIDWALHGLTTTAGQVYTGVTVAEMRVEIDPTLRGLKDFTDPYATLRSGYSQYRADRVREAKGVGQAQAVDALPDFGDDPSAAKR